MWQYLIACEAVHLAHFHRATSIACTALQESYSNSVVVFQWWYSGVTVALQWCYSVSYWCYSGVTVVLHNGTVVLQCQYLVACQTVTLDHFDREASIQARVHSGHGCPLGVYRLDGHLIRVSKISRARKSIRISRAENRE
jgi:hypothetical protein